MQDDNQEKKLGDLLRNHQENHPLPYEQGAWESFERFRQPKIRPIWYWAGGIAASLLLLWAVGNLMWSETNSSMQESEEYLSEDLSANSLQNLAAQEEEISGAPSEKGVDSAEIPITASQIPSSTPSPQRAKASQNKSEAKVLPKVGEAKAPGLAAGLAMEETSEQALEERVVTPTLSQQVAATIADSLVPAYLSEEEAKAKLMAQLGEIESEKDEESARKGKSLALGFGPGFGSSGGDEPSSGSSLNLGVLMGVNLGEKLTLSSGLGLNYFNQASERQLYAQVAGFASAVRETEQIRQVQVDIPLYVTYPVTSKGSISVQAGFSNLIAFNQSAQLESNYTRQIAVADTESAFSNTLKLQSQPVTQVSELAVPAQRFYPFATANFGVNIRIFERQNTSYALMPFYNYPLQEYTGNGQKLGFYGASFKILFGQTGKK